MRFHSMCLPVVLLLGSIVGCSGPVYEPVPATPVKGKVIYQGKPLTKGVLMAESDINASETSADIQTDGTFEFKGFNGKAGLSPGLYRVYVAGVNKSQVAPKFQAANTSKTTFEVKADQAEYTVEFK